MYRRPRYIPYSRVGIKTINTYLPTELLREIFLYSTESNHMKSGQLASVCRYWRSVITTMSHLWSTLKVGTWTETDQVTTWLRRAYPKKVIIDTQGDGQLSSDALPFAALWHALSSTGHWNELTISSFPPEASAGRLGIQAATAMDMLKVLHIEAGCMHSPSFAHLLNLVPTDAPLSELRLYSSFASTHFLQRHYSSVFQNLTVTIISGRDVDTPFEFLPTFTQLQIFEADRLRLPFYEPNTNLPLLCTLRKLRLRACSIQWMAGRQFPYFEECAILLPRHWEVVQQHEVQLPSCKKLTYHGHPMTTAQYFRAPEMRAMDLRSHDHNEQRVYRQLRHLCRVDGGISKLTALHITFQCSEQVLIKVLKYLVPLQELVLSIAYPSSSWQDFLESLAAKPSTNGWPEWDQWDIDHRKWGQWCSSQTWHATILPYLKYLGIQCPKGFSQSECIDNSPLFRLVGWTRKHLTPPLEHLKVWEGRGNTDDIVVDYISTGYLDKPLEISHETYDLKIVKGMVTKHLILDHFSTLLLLLHSTALFRRLQHLVLIFNNNHEIPILPCLEQIKRLEIWGGIIPVYSLNLDLPLTHTLQWLELRQSTSSWMLGRTFSALREFHNDWSPFAPESLSRHEVLQVDLPACAALHLKGCTMDSLRFFSCSNVQNLLWSQISTWITFDLAALNSLHDFAYNLSCLQHLNISVALYSGHDSLIQLVFRDAREQGVWQDIGSVKLEVQFTSFTEASHFFDQTVGHQEDYKIWWKKFTVTNEFAHVTVNASM